MSASSMEIHKRLLEVQKQVGVVSKDGKNTDQGYRFQQWEDIALEIREALNAQGVTIDVSVSGAPIRQEYPRSNGKVMISTLVPLQIKFFCEAGETSADWYGESADYSDKSLGKAITSGVKGYLLKRFLIPVKPPEKESDEGSPEPGDKVPQRAKEKPPEPPRQNGESKSAHIIVEPDKELPRAFWSLSKAEKELTLGDNLEIRKEKIADKEVWMVRLK